MHLIASPTVSRSFRRARVASFVLLACTSLSGCKIFSDPPKPTASVAAHSMSPRMDWTQFELGPNDIIRVQVFGHPELGTHLDGGRASGQGTLSLPLVGEVNVNGRTPEELEREIEERLATFFREPDATVSVVTYNARKYYIVGEVEKPGEYVMDRPLNALQAIAGGGRFNRGANREEVLLMRGWGPNLEIAMFNAETPDDRAFTAVRPDDILLVQRKGSSIFEERILPIISGVTTVANSAAYFGLVYNAWYNSKHN